MKYIFTFKSTHAALLAEKKLKQKDLYPQLVATPRSINSRCGFCLLLNIDDGYNVQEKIKNTGIVFDAFFSKQMHGGTKIYTEIKKDLSYDQKD